MTDGLAKYIVSRGKKFAEERLLHLLKIHSQKEFTEFVRTKREEGETALTDDLTLYIIHIRENRWPRYTFVLPGRDSTCTI